MTPVTVIIPAYNMAPWIQDTLDSVARQTAPDFRCVVVDDGSTDATAAIVRRMAAADPRFTLLSQENAGVCAARNAGLAAVETPFVAMLDADDLWHPRFLEAMLHPLRQPGVLLTWCHCVMFHDGSATRKPKAWQNIHRSGNVWWDMLMDSEFCMGAWAADTAAVRQAGVFDTRYKVGEDRDFLLRLLALICREDAGAAAHVPHALLFYRQHPGSAVRNAEAALRQEWAMQNGHIDAPGVPERIRRRARSFLAFKMAVIAAFAAHRPGLALRWYWRALRLDPANLNLYWLPLRKLALSLMPPGTTDFGLGPRG